MQGMELLFLLGNFPLKKVLSESQFSKLSEIPLLPLPKSKM